MFEPNKINDIQRYSALSEQVAELAKSITSVNDLQAVSAIFSQGLTS